MESIKEQKSKLREIVKERLRALAPKTRRDSDAAICERIIARPEYQSAQTIFAFVGVDWEIDTGAILADAFARGKWVAVPLCVGKGIMEARLINSLEDLVPGFYDIPEPRRETTLCQPQEIDFGVIPCISCSTQGRRLGQGGGYYDRFLEEATFPCAAVCREIALVEDIPLEPWDQPVDCVVTENKIYCLTE